MVPPDVAPPSIETRLNLTSRRILLLLGEQGSAPVESLGAVLQIPSDMAHLSVGWLARSRVVELAQDSAGKLEVRLRRPFE